MAISIVAKKLKENGYSDVAIAGILGNIEQESKFDTKAVGDGGTSHGIAQWHNERAYRLKGYARNVKKDWRDPELQADFLVKEIDNDPRFRGLKDQLNRSRSPEESAHIFAKRFEAPKEIDTNRHKNARAFYNLIGRGVISEAKAEEVDEDFLPVEKALVDPDNEFVDPNEFENELESEMLDPGKGDETFVDPSEIGNDEEFVDPNALGDDFVDPNVLNAGVGDPSKDNRPIVLDPRTSGGAISVELPKYGPPVKEETGGTMKDTWDQLTTLESEGSLGKVLEGLNNLGIGLVAMPASAIADVSGMTKTTGRQFVRDIVALDTVLGVATAGMTGPNVGQTVKGVGKSVVKGLSKVDDVTRDVMGLRQAAMTSRPSTAIRNFTTFLGRASFEGASEAIDSAIGYGRNAVRQALGKPPIPNMRPWSEVGGTIENLIHYMRTKDKFDNVIDYIDKTGREDVFLGDIMKDILLGARSARNSMSSSTLNKVGDYLSYFNVLQEKVARRVGFMHYLDESIRKSGIAKNSDELIKNGIPIPEMSINRAVTESLRSTWAQDPLPNSVSGQLLKTFHKIPGDLGLLIVDFPRYVHNGMVALGEMTPLGAYKLMGKSTRRAIANGDHKALSNFIVSMGLVTAFEAGYQNLAGSSPTKIKVGENGRELDISAYQPFAAAWAAVDLAHRAVDGRLSKEMLLDTINKSMPSPVDSFDFKLFDNFINMLSSGSDQEKTDQKFVDFASKIGASFLTPVQLMKDLFDTTEAITEDENVIQKDTSGTNAMKKSFSNDVPAQQNALSANPTQKTQGEAVAGLLGATVRTDALPVREASRLGLSNFDVTPYTGVREVDRMARERIGKSAEGALTDLVNSEEYKSLPVEEQKYRFKKAYKEIESKEMKGIKKDLLNSTPADRNKAALIDYYKMAKDERVMLKKLHPELQDHLVMKQVTPEDVFRFNVEAKLYKFGMKKSEIMEVDAEDINQISNMLKVRKDIKEEIKIKAWINNRRKVLGQVDE